MAKNITREEWASICGYGAVRAPSSSDTTTKEYVGHLTGDVTGNADTATALKNSWQLNLVGDVSGSAVLNNSDTNLSVTVQEAQHAVNADNAKQTQACAHASFADLANLATLAIKSQTSINSEYAVEAQHAETATNADNAEYAKEAQHSVKSDLATNATNATNAVKATRDVNGNQIDTTYMTKTEGATKDELLKTILVAGKASGLGTVEGTSVTIKIDSIIGGGESGSSTSFVFVSDLPPNADINNVYINADLGKLWIYDTEGTYWHDVLVKLTGDITALNQSISSVSASIDTKISASETNILGQVDVKINSAKKEVNNYTDTQISTAKNEVNSYTDNSVNNAKTSLNETIINKTESAKNEANSYTDTQVSTAKNEANSYTDTQIRETDAKILELNSKLNDFATKEENEQKIDKAGPRGELGGSEISKELVGDQTITKDSSDSIVINTTGATTLTFTPAELTECAVKVISLTATNETTLTFNNATWANAGEAPTWGTTGKHLVIIAHFISGRVILSVSDNDEV